ncbi:MAG: isoprenylcysteine carboxylmethyltransferase family protein [Methanotrichaceae archaeon]
MASVLAVAAYFVLFGLLHSILADPGPKMLARRIFGVAADRWYRIAYIILALIMVTPFFYILAFLPDKVLYAVRAPWKWLMMAGQVLAAFGVLIALAQTNIDYFFGLAQLRGQRGSGGLVTNGFYCHLRNPLFLFGIVFLWLFPYMTLNLLTFNILATVYFYIGAIHEETSLFEEFGEQYRRYRQKVPMFIPRLRCES